MNKLTYPINQVINTIFYGIYIIKELPEDNFWILQSDNGNEEFFNHYPTEHEIIDFRNECLF